MRKTLLAVAMVGLLGFIPVSGHATALSGGKCTLSGTVDSDSPIAATPATMTYSLDGSVSCSGVAANDTPAGGQIGLAGDLHGLGSGFIGCAGGDSSGVFEADFGTGLNADNQQTQDVWIGQYATVGTVVSAIKGNILEIDHQHFDETIDNGDGTFGAWVTDSTDTVSHSLVLGEFRFSVDDPTVCTGAGTQEARFDGNALFGYTV